MWQPVWIRGRTLASILALAIGWGCTGETSDPSSASVAETSSARSAAPDEGGPVTFYKHIAPIVYEHCAACHRAGEAAPFSLLSYEDVKTHAEQIKDVTAHRFMPPWLAKPGVNQFIGERGLSDDQVQVIEDWVDQGAVEGSRADAPERPTFSNDWQLGNPDLVVAMPEPYQLPASGTDVYRTFVLPVEVEGTRYVKAVELRPGNKRVVHHAIMTVDGSGKAHLRDALELEPGYAGMDLLGTENPDGHFVGWAPGSTPFPGFDDMAWRLNTKSDLLLQLHMLPSGKTEAIKSEIGLYFADQPPTRHLLSIPLRSLTIDIPAGSKDYRIRDEFELPVSAEVVGVLPHAHYLGKEMKGFASLPDGSTKWLIHIPEWDFNWQEAYRHVEPIALPKGAVLTMDFTYDNSAENIRNPHQPPRRVRYGVRSSEEMGELLVQVALRDLKDMAILREAMLRHLLKHAPNIPESYYHLGVHLHEHGKIEKAVYYFRRALQIDSEFAYGHLAWGKLSASQNDLDDAVAHFQSALQIQPEFSDAHRELAAIYRTQGKTQEADEHLRLAERSSAEAAALNNLGAKLLSQRKFDEAIEHFRGAIRAAPDLAEAHNNLANAMLFQKKLDEAVTSYRRAIDINPNYMEAHNNIGVALQSQGNVDEAAQHFQRALQIDPNLSEANYRLARILRQKGDVDQAITLFQRALQSNPNELRVLFDLSETLINAERGEEAVHLALAAAERSRRKQPLVLVLLAQAYAATDQMDEAVAAAEEALDLASTSGQEELVKTLRALLNQYRQARNAD